MPQRVAVIAGGLSFEREVSLRSGQRVADALTRAGHDVRLLDLDDGLVRTLAASPVDVAYLCLHGKAGEDGTVQGLLDLLGIPYTGPDAVASAMAWDKGVFKGMLRRAGIPTPAWVALSSIAVREMGAAGALDRVVEQLGVPLVAKPAQGGASLGVRYVDEPSSLPAALMAAFSYHDVVLLERFVDGTEVAVSIVGDEPLAPVEIHPKEGAYDFAARYTYGATELFAPARLDQAVRDRCRDVALAAYDLAGCRHVTRADLIVDAEGTPWLLELDTSPGMTETSLLPVAADADGWPFDALCGRVLDLALATTAPRVSLEEDTRALR